MRFHQFVITVSSVAMVGTLAWAASSAYQGSDPFRDVPQAAFQGPVIPISAGESVALPDRDLFGREIPKARLAVVAMPACSSCAARKFDPLKERTKLRQPIVVVYSETSKDKLPEGLAEQSGIRVVLDPKAEVFPERVYSKAPLAVSVDGKGKIMEVHPVSVDIESFIARVAR